MTPQAVRRRVLVVDDDPNSRFIAERFLMKAGYDVLAAEDVGPALILLEREGTGAFGAVVTDYCMPGGTGLDLLRQVRAIDATLSFVIATAVGEKQLVADALREGASGFVDKPIQVQLLHEAVAKAVLRTEDQRGLQKTATAARALGESQVALLGLHTATLSDRIQIVYLPHSEASGDFVTAFQPDPERIVILASDVSGHDLKAAYKSIYFHGLARGMIERAAPLDQVFRRFNDLLLKDWNKGNLIETSIAALGVQWDMRAGLLTTLNCGFPRMVASGGDGSIVPQSTACSSPLGWFEEVPDGVEAAAPEGFLSFWSDGLEALAERLEIDPLALAYRLLAQGAENGPLLKFADDDIVVVRARIGSVAVQGAALPLFHQEVHGDALLRIDELQEYWERSLRIALPQLDDDRLFDVLLAAREGMINALKHGCAGDSARTAVLQIALRTDPGTLRLSVKDDGEGHDFAYDEYELVAARDLLTEHRGLVLMKNLADRLHVTERGTQITMDFSI